jgi:hypothetical protein
LLSPIARFPPPWTLEEKNDACFIVRDAIGLVARLRLFRRRAAAPLGDSPANARQGPAAWSPTLAKLPELLRGTPPKSDPSRGATATLHDSPRNVRLSSNSGSIAASRQVT